VTFDVAVTDGQLNVRFIRRDGTAVVNAIRVILRPDLSAGTGTSAPPLPSGRASGRPPDD
jgi:hypothetical protein